MLSAPRVLGGFVFSVFGSRNMGDPTPTLGLELGPGKKSLQAPVPMTGLLKVLLNGSVSIRVL